MDIKVEPKSIEDTYRTPIVQQTAFWSKVKGRLGLPSEVFEFTVRNSDIYVDVGGYSYSHGDLVLFYQYLNRDRYVAYCPYGPEMEPSAENQGRYLEELSESLKSFLPKGCIDIKYDLNWESHWAGDESCDASGNGSFVPEKNFQEMNLNFGTAGWNLHKANSDILPANTVIVDLRGSEEEILRRMHPKTRYNIRLSHTHGVEVRSVGSAGLDVWYGLYRETAIRNGLRLNDIRYFKSLFIPQMDEDGTDVQLLIAYHENVPLAAMFLVISNLRATYLYGASSSLDRNLMPTYALQWDAMCRAKACGCRDYDMFGVSPSSDPAHPMYGLYRFKKGFGGEMYHQLGCWDYPVDEKEYSRLLAYEMTLDGYYL